MKHVIVVLVVLLGAIACYVTGFSSGITLFVVAGVLLECVFWFMALRGSKRSS